MSLVWLATAASGAAAQSSGPPLDATAVAPGAPSEADPPAAIQTEYRDVVDRAIVEFDLGHFVEARALFLRAHELWPSARTRRTLGMTAFELRMYPQALEELQGALDDPHRPLPPAQRTQVSGLIEQTKRFVGRYQLQVEPAEAELLVDGAPHTQTGALVIGVGVHQLLVRAPGYGELRRELVVQGHEDKALVLRLDAFRVEPEVHAPPPAATARAAPKPTAIAPADESPNRAPAIIAFSVSGAGVIVGTVAGVLALNDKHDVEHLEAGHRAADISTAAWITAGVAAVTGTLLLVLERGPTRKDQASAVRPWVGLGSVGLEGRL
jgi:tetratricopeptide (TPR) repeat protein